MNDLSRQEMEDIIAAAGKMAIAVQHLEAALRVLIEPKAADPHYPKNLHTAIEELQRAKKDYDRLLTGAAMREHIKSHKKSSFDADIALLQKVSQNTFGVTNGVVLMLTTALRGKRLGKTVEQIKDVLAAIRFDHGYNDEVEESVLRLVLQ